MEVMMPSPAGAEFNFNSTFTSPIGSAPSSPRGGSDNYFFSAPTSPTSASVFYRQISFAFTTGGCASLAPQKPCDWEENLENPECPEELFTHSNNSEEDEADTTTDFYFDFSGQLEPTPTSPADELFDGGKIKPLEPPPKKILRNALSFRKKKKHSEPCTKTIIETRNDTNAFEGRDQRGRERVYDSCTKTIIETRNDTNAFEGRDQRGRERVYDSSSSTRRQKGSKSLSPLRDSNMVSKPILNDERSSKQISPSLVTSSNSNSSSSWYGRWKLTDLLLFRSASEGHATNKKYDFFKKSQTEDVKSSSFMSKDKSGSVSNGRRKKEIVSSHQWHYKVNRPAAGEMRRKTFLPYKQNLMGCMDLDAVVREPSGRSISNSQVMMRQY